MQIDATRKATHKTTQLQLLQCVPQFKAGRPLRCGEVEMFKLHIENRTIKHIGINE